MELRRIKGRPPRGFGDVGRDKLVEAARTLLQKKTQVDINRKEIADVAGVTPALVSYYFPDRQKLIEAAAEPVIADASKRLTAILHGPDTNIVKIRAIIRAFVVFSSVNSALLEHYLHRLKRRDRIEGHDAALSAYVSSVSFLQELMNAGVLRRSDPNFTLLALWGMCRVIAQDFDTLTRHHSDGDAAQDSVDLRTDAIFDLFFEGAGMRPAPQREHAKDEPHGPAKRDPWTGAVMNGSSDRGRLHNGANAIMNRDGAEDRKAVCNGATV